MKKRRFLSTVILGVFLAITHISTESLYAREKRGLRDDLKIPDPTNVQILVTKDGSTLIGRIIKVKENEVAFETSVGTIVIPELECLFFRDLSSMNKYFISLRK